MAWLTPEGERAVQVILACICTAIVLGLAAWLLYDAAQHSGLTAAFVRTVIMGYFGIVAAAAWRG